MSKKQEQLIFEFIQEKQFAKVENIASALNVSTSTVRRKLSALQEKGLVIRTHGGVQLNDTNNYFPSFTFRSHKNSLEKKKMALAAIKLIKNGDLIFLDGSTSAFYIAEYLKEFNDIRVVTNGIDTLSLLSKNNVTAYSTGGKISPTNRSVLVGEQTANAFNNYRADIAFLSTSSITKDGGVFDCFEEEVSSRRSLIKNASKVVLLCDSTKFGGSGQYKICDVDDVDFIISDSDKKDYFDNEISAEFICEK